MHLVSFYIDSAERACRTKVLASTTADAYLGIHYRNAENLTLVYWLALSIHPFAILVHLIRLVDRHHLDSSAWTFTCTVATGLAVSKRYAVLLHPNGMTYLYGSLLLYGYRKNSTCRTNIRASRTLWTAIALFVFHNRLHESFQRCIWPQHTIRAVANAKLACCTMLLQVTRRY